MRKTFLKTFAGLFMFVLSGASSATDRHTQVIAATCMTCHGPGGTSQSELMPSLAGLQVSEFLKAMQEFRSGVREASIMKRHAAGYTDAEFEAMAAYFAALK
jgi:cytochrome c553